MRSAAFASALLATLAMGKPLEKRYYLTETEVSTVYTTVTRPAGQYTVVVPAKGQNTDPGTSTVTTVYVTASAGAPAPTSSVEVTTEAAEPTAAAPSTTATPEAPTSAASSAVASATGANTYQNIVLNQHNLHRANHSATAFTWNDTLASIAQTIAESCVYAHNTKAGGGGYGQNIGAGTTADEVGSMITNEMYNGEINNYPLPYGNNNPDMSGFEGWGHFSQIVWQDTHTVGCATVNCPSGLANVGSGVQPYFTVCNYYPPGNFAGEYSNVGAPLGKATVTA